MEFGVRNQEGEEIAGIYIVRRLSNLISSLD